MPVRPDACPGVFALHDAADGALARVRLPGGAVGAAALRVLAGCADDLGDGAVHLTSRGNVQLRGLDRDDHRLAERLTAAGLLPSPAHERARNVLASPLSGIAGGLADVRALAPALDRGLCARPELAALPGRFLFALDDGRGDVAGEEPDLCWQAVSPGRGLLRVAGTPVAEVPIARAVAVLLDAAAEFLDGADGAWRARDVPGPQGPPAPAEPTAPPEGPTAARVGWVGGALVCSPPLGELSAAQLRVLAGAGPTVLVTPWRTLVLPDAAPGTDARLVAAGFVVDPASPVPLVSACAGRPGCAKALADVRADARAGLAADRFTGRVHLSGCARRCGSPRGAHRALVATGDGRYAG
ncbi:precorrin-3B synthase [Pseudonocardia humida]|uniref:Precorrin-3B synthase n=1 Tax=Pseudonocardia humida TaxID=2800819 RepID=A0ABT1AA40_9PSEU|nr:precorrin-3B synthase [Pseudonocardia humida]MCO1659811.1 precorrin-3B synthase [Pseudonocardia humida]